MANMEEKVPRHQKATTILIIALLIIGTLTCFWLVGHSAYVRGARVACDNSGMYLAEGFLCKERFAPMDLNSTGMRLI